MKFAAPGSLILALAIATVANADQRPGSNAKQVETQVLQQMRSFEHQLEQAEQVLKQKMQRAASLRQRGLKDNNGEMLEQAESLERQAVAEYQQQIERFEKYSKRLSNVTTERAKSQAATYNKQAPQAEAESAPQRRNPERINRSILQRRGYRPEQAPRSLKPVPRPEEQEQESRGWFRPLRRWFSN